MADRHGTLGDQIASGNTSEVWSWSSGSVVKLLRPGIPRHWAAMEADVTGRAHAAGLPAPATRGVIEVGDRVGIVFERVEGESMWTRIKAHPDETRELIDGLVDLQAAIHAAPPVTGLQSLVPRMSAKIGKARQISAEERGQALEVLDKLPDGQALCHGDVHPANILLGPDGYVLVDWFDAAAGHPMADYARSSLLMRPPLTTRPIVSFLDGATPELLERLHTAYLDALEQRGLTTDASFWRWEAVMAVARMSEPVPTTDLAAIWRRRPRAAEEASARG